MRPVKCELHSRIKFGFLAITQCFPPPAGNYIASSPHFYWSQLEFKPALSDIHSRNTCETDDFWGDIFSTNFFLHWKEMEVQCLNLILLNWPYLTSGWRQWCNIWETQDMYVKNFTAESNIQARKQRNWGSHVDSYENECVIGCRVV